jgi:hypothetical protein
MLTTTMELWPFGDQRSAKRLVTINIANVGCNPNDITKTDYVWTIDETDPLFGSPIKAEGVLKKYDRNAAATSILIAVLQEYLEPQDNMDPKYNTIVNSMRNKTLKKP